MGGDFTDRGSLQVGFTLMGLLPSSLKLTIVTQDDLEGL